MKYDTDIEYCNGNSSAKYPPFNPTIATVIYAIQFSLIPFIVLSSVLIIYSISIKPDLHKPHNIILLAIAILDLITAVIGIPLEAINAIAHSVSISYICNKILCPLRTVPILFMVDLKCTFLMWMSMDRFILVNFSHHYHLRFTNRKTKEILISFAAFSFVIFTSFIFIQLYGYGEHYFCHFNGVSFNNWYMQLSVIFFSIRLFVSLVCCFQLLSCSRSDIPTPYDITVLLIVFILLNGLPWLVLSQYNASELSMLIVRSLRLLTPLTTGIIIMNTRIYFRDCFIFLLTTPPNKWNHLKNPQEIFNRRRLSMRSKSFVWTNEKRLEQCPRYEGKVNLEMSSSQYPTNTFLMDYATSQYNSSDPPHESCLSLNLDSQQESADSRSTKSVCTCTQCRSKSIVSTNKSIVSTIARGYHS